MVPDRSVGRDLIVVVPGIMGSTLAKNGRLVWSPSAGSLLRAIRTFGGSVRELTLPVGLGDDDPKDGVVAPGLMPDVHVLPGVWSVTVGYQGLVGFLEGLQAAAGVKGASGVLAFPYDWRLSNRLNGRRLKVAAESALDQWRARGGPFAEAKLVFVCHSMGGLVARWFIECEGGAEITRKLITLGTPFRGALDALEHLVNGMRKGFGPLELNFSAFARSLPSMYQLLPEYACIDVDGVRLKTIEVPLPSEALSGMVADAMRFHDQMDEAAAARKSQMVELHPLLGIHQPTSSEQSGSGPVVLRVGCAGPLLVGARTTEHG